MSRHLLLAGLVSMAFAGSALADGQCSCVPGATRLSATAITTDLVGKTVCAIQGSDKWQEYLSGGVVTDYKKGPTDPVDPSEDVGTYAVAGGLTDATITYNYGSSSYQFEVCSQASSYHFCGTPRNVTNATLIPGKASCGF